jgi:hypothetical protein
MTLHIARPDDGSTLIEWIAPRWRFGVCLECKISQSSWYFVAKDGTQRSGYLLQEEELKAWDALSDESLANSLATIEAEGTGNDGH